MDKTARILLVDDETDILRGLTIRFRALGYEVLTANDGAAGLTSATTEQPDLIILDVRMPVMDGLTMLARLGEQPATRDIPCIVLTANISESNRREAVRLGARDFVQKPFDAKTLVQRVSSLLQEKESDEEPPNSVDRRR